MKAKLKKEIKKNFVDEEALAQIVGIFERLYILKGCFGNFDDFIFNLLQGCFNSEFLK